ncbi:hypothetical protein DKT77_03445 [Meridianimarinicoccus roseus]|uniref:Uncharacterized protein n=1 Tax=Meridianimarinicoccus roseus TaxID=2072018 RepID=A0A2V2LM20_9RHOB|nr:hypothetical protein [Meridianimarinicoccus roseus]PWR04107.1 hypothetical protein DKT77_03445 [Meridianimarinicoccus roseus]
MFLELIATFVIGLGGAGTVLLLNKVMRGRLPGWLMPATAGLSMIAFSIWSEYTWYPRTANNLPDKVVVAWANEDSAPWKPWTYALPQTNRFVAVDTGTIRTNDGLPGQRMVDLYFMGRWAPGRQVSVVFDCDGNRRAELGPNAAMDERGALSPDAWTTMAPDDPVLRTACRAEVG